MIEYLVSVKNCSSKKIALGRHFAHGCESDVEEKSLQLRQSVEMATILAGVAMRESDCDSEAAMKIAVMAVKSKMIATAVAAATMKLCCCFDELEHLCSSRRANQRRRLVHRD